MKQPKIGFIGYGRHAKLNLYPAIEHLGYKIQTVATLHEETAKAAHEKYNTDSYHTDHKELLKEDIDCVFIAVKTEEQVPLVIDALEAGKDVFVEKTLGINAKEAKQVAEVSKKTGKKVQVGFMKRYSPAYSKAKELLTSKEFGETLSLSMNYTSRSFSDKSSIYLLYAGIHYIDLITHYLGDIEEITGHESLKGEALAQTFSMKAKNGAIASINFTSSPAWKSHIEKIQLSSENGYIKIEGAHRLRYHIDAKGSGTPGWQTLEEDEVVLNSTSSMSAGGLTPLYLNGFIGEVKHFLESIEKGTLENGVDENVRTMDLYDRMSVILLG